MTNKKISSLLEEIKDISTEDVITVGTILDNIKDSKYLVILFTTILILAPIPILSTIFGIICATLMVQIISGKKKLALPTFVLNFKIKRKALVYSLDKINYLLKKIERFTKNRLLFFTNEKFINISLLFLSILSISPVPLACFFAGFGMVLIIFGFLNKDGLFIPLGILSGMIDICIHIILFICGANFLSKLMH
ncbi:MAG: exopolysaccharide biosynthesis protein [Rickettsiales bacterium]|nr:exopolysaccharide biosynthesis protein [Rickettsiales bacterium]